MPPMLYLFVRLMRNTSGPLGDTNTPIQCVFALINFNASFHILRRTRWGQNLRAHVAKHTINANKVRALGRGSVAQGGCIMASVVGHDILLGHPSRTVVAAALAASRLGCIQVLTRMRLHTVRGGSK
jgi:hypothetical protein